MARLIARQTGAILKELSATDVGVHDVRAVLEEAKNLLVLTGRCADGHHRVILLTPLDRQTILFLDEIHRFNKGQQVRFVFVMSSVIYDPLYIQDILLPYVEQGHIQVSAALFTCKRWLTSLTSSWVLPQRIHPSG